MKAYVSDTEDLKLDPSYQETWDDMIINVRHYLKHRWTPVLSFWWRSYNLYLNSYDFVHYFVY